MAKSKYDPDTFPLKVQKLARDGFSDKEIYQSLGISKDTFYRYLRDYSDFSDAHRRGREPVTVKVENAFLQRCLGEDYESITKRIIEVPTTTITKIVDANGIVIDVKTSVEKTRTIQLSTTNKKVLPDVGACKYWLQVNDPKWKSEKGHATGAGFSSFSDLMVAYADLEKEELNNDKDE